MEADRPANVDRVLVKKYENRRLYDTTQSRYITLAELADIVRRGADVEVVDAKSGKDLTRQVLTQVILDQQERLNMIPVELLHFIIRTQGTLQQGPFSSFLSLITEQFTSQGNLWGRQMAQMFDLQGFAPKAANTGASTPAGQGGKKPDDQQDMESLRSRMDALLKSMGNED
jgi:polyhydroxyalkanoate synthesis repressor PhaR